MNIKQNYDEFLKYEKELFLSSVQYLISENKYNIIDINQYIKEYNAQIRMFNGRGMTIYR